MNSTVIFIAQIMGPVYIVAALMLIARPGLYDKIMEDFTKSPALAYFSGIVVIAIGTLWINSLYSWANFTESVFTVLGIIALLKGILLVLVPKALLSVGCKCPAFKLIGGFIALGFAVWFFSIGYGLF